MKTTKGKTKKTMPTTMTTDRSEPHVVSDKVFTVTSALKDIESVLGNARRMFDRKAYMDLLVRVNDDTQERLNTCNDEIGAEMHERRDD